MRSANGRGARRGLAPRARARINRELAEQPGGEPAAEQAETLPPGRSRLGGFLRRQGPRLAEIAWLASLGFLVGGLGLAVLSLLMLLDALRVLDLAWVPREPAILALGVALTVGIIGWLLLGLVVEASALPHLYRRFTTSGNLGKLWIALAVAGGALGGLAWIFSWLTSPVSEVLSRAWLLLLATGGAGVFIVAPVTVPILWLVERRAPAPTSKLLLPVLLVSWAAGAAVLFGWLASRW